MNLHNDFLNQVIENVNGIKNDASFLDLSLKWNQAAIKHNYAHNFSWLGRPIIQVPQDIYAIQELIWTVKPVTIIETGIAHGGSLILSASMLALLDYCEAISNRTFIDPEVSNRKVIGVDIDIRKHNYDAIKKHPLSHLIELVEGSSVDPSVVHKVSSRINTSGPVLIFLDSNHTHNHVLEELKCYAKFTTMGSYCVVWDTGVEDLPDGFVTNREWGKGNNPKTAVLDFLKNQEITCNYDVNGLPLRFEIDKFIENKLAITASPDGFLKRI